MPSILTHDLELVPLEQSSPTLPLRAVPVATNFTLHVFRLEWGGETALYDQNYRASTNLREGISREGFVEQKGSALKSRRDGDGSGVSSVPSSCSTHIKAAINEELKHAE